MAKLNDFLASMVTVKKYMKDNKGGNNSMANLICYCFNYTDDDIKEDVLKNNGKSTIMERIVNEKKAGNCQCETKNPKGK